MANTPNPEGKSAATPNGETGAGAARELADLLTSANHGIFLRGVVLAVEEPEKVEGKSAKGREYKFFTRRMTLWAGGKAVRAAQVRDAAMEFTPMRVGSEQTFVVESVRLDRETMVFKVA